MQPTSQQNAADLADELIALRQEVRDLRESIDEFRDDLLHAIRNLPSALAPNDLNELKMPNPSTQGEPHREQAALAAASITKANHVPAKLDPIDFRQLKLDVPITKVLELYHWKPVKRSGQQLRGPCPVHGSKSETSQILSVSPKKNAWKCFKCEAGGNQLDLAAHYFRIPKDQVVRVAVALCRELRIDVPRLS